MSLRDVKIPLWKSSGEDNNHELIVNKFAGRICLKIKTGGNELDIECYFDDLQRAWEAVK